MSCRRSRQHVKPGTQRLLAFSHIHICNPANFPSNRRLAAACDFSQEPVRRAGNIPDYPSRAPGATSGKASSARYSIGGVKHIKCYFRMAILRNANAISDGNRLVFESGILRLPTPAWQILGLWLCLS